MIRAKLPELKNPGSENLKVNKICKACILQGSQK